MNAPKPTNLVSDNYFLRKFNVVEYPNTDTISEYGSFLFVEPVDRELVETFIADGYRVADVYLDESGEGRMVLIDGGISDDVDDDKIGYYIYTAP